MIDYRFKGYRWRRQRKTYGEDYRIIHWLIPLVTYWNHAKAPLSYRWSTRNGKLLRPNKHITRTALRIRLANFRKVR